MINCDGEISVNKSEMSVVEYVVRKGVMRTWERNRKRRWISSEYAFSCRKQSYEGERNEPAPDYRELERL